MAIKLEIESLGYAVYDGFMPPEGTAYPFVYLGDMQQTDQNTKGGVIGNAFPVVHVWSNTPRNRGTVSKMLLEIKRKMRGIEHTKNFSWCVLRMNQRIFSDNTTKTPLLHGVLEAEYKFS